MNKNLSMFDDIKENVSDISSPIVSKSRNRKDSKVPEVIEFHDPVICERVKIRCEKCKVVFSCIYNENHRYGFCSQCMGKVFTEIEGSRRVF
jgi:hypothetical protein